MNFDSIIKLLSPIDTTMVNEVEGEVIFKKIEDPNFDKLSIGWCSDKNLDILQQLTTGTVILSEIAQKYCEENNINSFNKIIVNHPRKAFVDVVNHFLASSVKFGDIASTAQISNSVKLNPVKSKSNSSFLSIFNSSANNLFSHLDSSPDLLSIIRYAIASFLENSLLTI